MKTIKIANELPLEYLKKDNSKKPIDAISKRQSGEIVIAFSGPIGCGIKSVRDQVSDTLKALGYKVNIIKISDILKQCITRNLITDPINKNLSALGYDRYTQMQDAGNSLRKIEHDILAEYAIQEIAKTRGRLAPDTIDDLDVVPGRNAYLIDQLKHPEEVKLLRMVYGNLFYLFGVLSTTGNRIKRLKSERIEDAQISELIGRDRKERDKNGQQLEKTLQLADFFIRNDSYNSDSSKEHIARFFNLIHGENGITPTREEYGMYTAHSAGLRSACLSRQIGASIMTKEGVIIATGRNDVPSPRGGLYGPEDGKKDARCVKLEGKKCFNDTEKGNLRDDIEQIIRDGLSSGTISGDINLISKTIADLAYQNTRLSGLIEFSRAIHAEMDAIVSLAFKGNGSTQDCSLFTYTFPCHNCARHIVAAGITTVYFLEPYEKSMALDLHHDSIVLEGDDNETDSVKVKFIHFEGVAPRQYMNLFHMMKERKDSNGVAITQMLNESNKKIPELLDDYRIYEGKVAIHLNQTLGTLSKTNSP